MYDWHVNFLCVLEVRDYIPFATESLLEVKDYFVCIWSNLDINFGGTDITFCFSPIEVNKSMYLVKMFVNLRDLAFRCSIECVGSAL